jgi:protein-tyrosine sulfotransferase
MPTVNRVLTRMKRRLQRRLVHARTQFHAARTRHPELGAMAPPIFVVGCQRSGTSLLRRILDSHPSIACPPESKFILPLEELVRDPQALRGLDSMGFTRQEVMNRLRSFVVSFFQDYALAKGKERWADKTPNYVDCLPFLDEIFAGEARYIVIVRHPFDVCLSFEHAAEKSGQPMPAIQSHIAGATDFRAGACAFWNRQNRKISEFVPHVAGRAVSLDYELLTSQPEPVLRQMFDFLDIPWSPLVLDYGQLPHDYGFEDRKIERMPKIVPNFGGFLAWPAEERQRLAVVAQEAMHLLGYSPHQAHRQRAAAELERSFIRVDHV